MKYVPNPKQVDGWHYEMKCLHCGSKFQAKRRTAKYCSNTCRSMAFNLKDKPKPNEKILCNTKADMSQYFVKNGVKGFSYEGFFLSPGESKEKNGYRVTRTGKTYQIEKIK